MTKSKTVVILATYNGRDRIISQIDSIKNQTQKPDYVIIRDDGSMDDTVVVVNSYIEKHKLNGWKIIQNTTNLGWRGNFRALLFDSLQTDADYIFFSDQDDEWYLEKIEKQIHVMEERSDIELLSHDFDSKPEGYFERYTQFDKNENISKYQVLLPSSYMFVNRLGWTYCLKRSLVEKVMEVWTEGNSMIAHDNLFFYASSISGTGYNLNERLGCHFRHENNASGNKYNLTLKSSISQNVQELGMDFQISNVVLKFANNHCKSFSERLQSLDDFQKVRYENAKNKKLLRTVVQTIKYRKMYASHTGIIRDLVFALKSKFSK